MQRRLSDCSDRNGDDKDTVLTCYIKGERSKRRSKKMKRKNKYKSKKNLKCKKEMNKNGTNQETVLT